MPSHLLITKADFAGHIDLPGNLDVDKKLNPMILHAQDFDLCRLLGNNFYYDLLNNYNSSVVEPKVFTEPYLALIDGAEYTNADDVVISFDGLKPVLVFYAAARLIKELDMHITPSGMMQKRNEFSDPTDLKEKIFRANQYESSAVAYWEKAALYLDAKKADFKFWKSECNTTRSTGARRMRPVGYKNQS